MTTKNAFLKNKFGLKFPTLSPIALALIVTSSYWFYLAFFTEIWIYHDSIGYEHLGKLLKDNGWIEYFKTGPNREPIYPFLISLSMRIGKQLSVDYLTIQILMQMLILFITQILMVDLLKKLNINRYICALTILYIGISPAIINSIYRLYSEIAAYPLILAIIIFNYKSWEILQSPDSRIKPVFKLSFLLGISCVCMTLIKGIFEIIIPFLLILFCSFFIRSLIQKDSIRKRKSLIFLIVFIVIYWGSIISYKSFNYKYNQNFVLTDRGSFAIYGNTARRIHPLNKEKFLCALTMVVPRIDFCTNFFSEKECLFWSYTASDEFAKSKITELSKTMSNQEVNKELNHLSVRKALENPFQYILLFTVEGLKMYFWEARSKQYVVYPNELTKILKWQPLLYWVHIVMPLITIISIFYAVRYTWYRRNLIYNSTIESNSRLLILCTMLYCILLYIGAHSFFYILDRYSFPLVPVYLILIAFMIQNIAVKFKKS